MPEYLRALVYVLIVAPPIFFLGRKVTRGTVSDDEFSLWRNCWFAATLSLFMASNFLLFGLALALLSIYAHTRPFNAIYLYVVLLFVAPALNVDVGVPGLINLIADFSPARLLSLFFLAPASIALFQRNSSVSVVVTDYFVAAYVVLLLILSFRLGEITHVLRVFLLYTLDIFLPYFVFSRTLKTLSEIRKALLAFVIAALPAAAMGVIEIAKGWRLFTFVADRWDIHLLAPYLFRDGLLRAAVTSVEPIAFGFVCMAALGCFMSGYKLRRLNIVDLAAFAILFAGLSASVSRGPWVGFAVLVFFAAAVSPRGLVNLAYASGTLGLSLLPLMMTPFGERVYRLLPFVGSVERGGAEYRSNLIEVSFAVIERYPFFGSPSFLKEPEMLRMVQGQGIIDVVNTYVAIALEFGLTSLIVFVAIFASIGMHLMSMCFANRTSIINFSAALGTLAAMAITIGTVSSVSVIPYIYWTLAGIYVAMFRVMALVRDECRDQVPPPRLKVIGP